MLSELERTINLGACVSLGTTGGCLDIRLTSVRGTRGGPMAISAAFVPGLIRLSAFASKGFLPSSPCSFGIAIGDLGPSWSSAIGGGLGSRGELEGDAAMSKFQRRAVLTRHFWVEFEDVCRHQLLSSIAVARERVDEVAVAARTSARQGFTCKAETLKNLSVGLNLEMGMQ